MLLHGQAFQASTWQETGTLEALGGHGVRAIAVDLPGEASHLPRCPPVHRQATAAPKVSAS